MPIVSPSILSLRARSRPQIGGQSGAQGGVPPHRRDPTREGIAGLMGSPMLMGLLRAIAADKKAGGAEEG
jgi:hypothetical protein